LEKPRILIIRGGAVGDFILTLPAIALIRETIKNSHIEVLGYKPIIALAEAAGLADSSRSIEHGGLAPFFVPGAELDREWTRYFGSFTLIVSYLFDPDGYFYGNLERCGVKTTLACAHRVDPSTGTHAAFQLAKPLESLAMYLEDPSPVIGIGAAAHQPDTIALHPGSGSAQKNWGYENWVLACEAIRRERPDMRFLITSGEAESDTIHEMLALLDARDIPYTHHSSPPLPELAALIRSCSLYLGHDSGISHLAAATGIPCLLLFGVTPSKIWAPQNPGVTVLDAPGGQLASLRPKQVTTAALPLIDTKTKN